MELAAYISSRTAATKARPRAVFVIDYWRDSLRRIAIILHLREMGTGIRIVVAPAIDYRKD